MEIKKIESMANHILFKKMKKKALELLSNVKCGPYTQSLVLLSVSGKEYGTVIENALSEKKDELALIQRLKDTKDTEITYVLCMWSDETIDIPSFAFRDLLISLNHKNLETLLFVMKKDGISSMKLLKTMK